jgi:hypothetical protein
LLEVIGNACKERKSKEEEGLCKQEDKGKEKEEVIFFLRFPRSSDLDEQMTRFNFSSDNVDNLGHSRDPS